MCIFIHITEPGSLSDEDITVDVAVDSQDNVAVVIHLQNINVSKERFLDDLHYMELCVFTRRKYLVHEGLLCIKSL